VLAAQQADRGWLVGSLTTLRQACGGADDLPNQLGAVSMKRTVRISLATALAPVLVFSSAVALSQESPAVTESISANPCKKPTIYTRMRRADDDSQFAEKSEAYKKCINEYVALQSDLSQKHTNAANAAVAEYNDFVKAVNARDKE
jgi:hypothetical protein